MSLIDTLKADAEGFLSRVRTDAGHLYDEGRALFSKLLGQAESDAATLAQEAETAGAPLVAEAKADATALAQEAVAGAEEAIGGGTKPTA